MYWEGSSLVLDRYENGDHKRREGHEFGQYSLSEDGKTFIALERYDDPTEKHLNKRVFDKKSP
jgi:hypothetical protein